MVTSRSRPVSTSKIKPRTGTSLAIQGCDLTFLICSFVCSAGSLYERKRMGTGDPSPVSFESFAFNSSSVKVVNPQPVWLRSRISFDPKTRVETTSSVQHFVRDGRTAVANDVHVSTLQAQYSLEVGKSVIHAGHHSDGRLRICT
jgi:hypothetical protein